MVLVPKTIREIDLDQAATELAILDYTGVGRQKACDLLSEKFGQRVTSTKLEQIRKHATYIKTRQEHVETLIKGAVMRLKERTSHLPDLIVETIEKALKDGNINAIPHALKILGIDSAEPAAKQTNQIQVVLAGARPKEKLVGGSDE